MWFSAAPRESTVKTRMVIDKSTDNAKRLTVVCETKPNQTGPNQSNQNETNQNGCLENLELENSDPLEK